MFANHEIDVYWNSIREYTKSKSNDDKMHKCISLLLSVNEQKTSFLVSTFFSLHLGCPKPEMAVTCVNNRELVSTLTHYSIKQEQCGHECIKSVKTNRKMVGMFILHS